MLNWMVVYAFHVASLVYLVILKILFRRLIPKLNEKVKAHLSSSAHLKCVLIMESFKDAHSIGTSLDQGLYCVKLSNF